MVLDTGYMAAAAVYVNRNWRKMNLKIQDVGCYIACSVATAVACVGTGGVQLII